MASKQEEVLARLASLGDQRVLARSGRSGSAGHQFGVPLGDIRKLAAEIKTDHELAVSLWETKIVDAQLLAILLLKPKAISRDDMDRMVRSVEATQVADWFSAYVCRKHPDNQALRQRWMTDDNRWAARAGWSLTSERIAKHPEGLDLPALLDRIESEMGNAAPEVQWTMNFCLAAIGIHFPRYRKRAIAIGEKLGLYRDYPVSKGCTSPFAPLWINEMVSRQA
jgi:3-methyladenine DNA glycosylase AlkD